MDYVILGTKYLEPMLVVDPRIKRTGIGYRPPLYESPPGIVDLYALMELQAKVDSALPVQCDAIDAA
jgi:hypothetical protein